MQEITWNPTRQVWETEQADLFSGQQEPYSATWPTSGMTRNGRLLPLPMSGHRTGENESLLLPTPQTVNRCSRRAMLGITDAKGNRNHWTSPGSEQAIEIAQGILPREFNSWDEVPGASRTILPTPRASDGTKGGPNQRGSSGDLMLPSAVMNME